MKVGKHSVEISNEDKVLFPESGLTKKDIIAFYLEIANNLLPQLKNRPLMLQRFPNGISEKGFYQKDASDYFPDWIEKVELDKEGGTVKHVLCNNKATLAYLCNQGTISFHSWLSTAAHPHYPDRFIIDLDPPSDEFSQVREGAFFVKEALDELEITSFVMTTGSSGLHVVVPLDAKSDFGTSREFGKSIGEMLINKHPGTFTFERLIDKRGGQIYFDIQRNAYAQTAIAPYSLRPTATAPVATPLSWSELHDKKIQSRSFHIKNITKRLSSTSDPWKGMKRHAISAKRALHKLRNTA